MGGCFHVYIIVSSSLYNILFHIYIISRSSSSQARLWLISYFAFVLFASFVVWTILCFRLSLCHSVFKKIICLHLSLCHSVFKKIIYLHFSLCHSVFKKTFVSIFHYVILSSKKSSVSICHYVILSSRKSSISIFHYVILSSRKTSFFICHYVILSQKNICLHLSLCHSVFKNPPVFVRLPVILSLIYSVCLMLKCLYKEAYKGPEKRRGICIRNEYVTIMYSAGYR